MVAHDGIVGTSDVGPVWAPAEAFDPPDGIRALGPGARATVLDFELLEPIAIRLEPDGSEKAAADGSGWRARVVLPSGDLVSIERPSSEQFARQLAYVRGYADLRPDRLAEIHMQLGDILSFFGAVDPLDVSRTPWTLELLGAGIRLAVAVEMRIKHALNCPRPIAYSPLVQPVVQSPAHASLPSGHATESAMVATILAHLAAAADLGDDAYGRAFAGVTGEAVAGHHQRFRAAVRIAVNRTVAGVHFPVDNAAGAVLGIVLGDYVAARASGQPATSSLEFLGGGYVPADDACGGDFHMQALADLMKFGATDRTDEVLRGRGGSVSVADCGGRHVAALWRLARAEVDAHFGRRPKAAGQADG